MYNKLMKIASRLAACLLALAIIFGVVVSGDGVVHTHAADSSAGSDMNVLVEPTQAVDGEKPYINIETNVVVDRATGGTTGYIELAVMVKTPEIEDGGSTSQTSFSHIDVTLEYNDELLMPVSWEHEIIYGSDDTTVLNAYPDFYAKTFMTDKELEELNKAIADGVGGSDNSGGSDDSGVLAAAYRASATVDQIVNDFTNEKLASVSLPVYQYDTDITSAYAFVGGAKPIISISVDSVADITFAQETPVAVVRFLYIGSEDLPDMVDRINGVSVVDPTELTSGHDRVDSGGGTLDSLFWFADDDVFDYGKNIPAGTAVSDKDLTLLNTKQILYYGSGDRVGEGIGENEFYSTKVPYDGGEVSLPAHISGGNNYWESKMYQHTAGDYLDIPQTGGTAEPTTAAEEMSLLTKRKLVLARTTDASVAIGAPGYYSYTSNLLYTSAKNDEYTEGTNVRFGVVAQETYRSTGGVDMGNIATIVFLDWDDTILGALAVEKGDARQMVNDYVENFIHPSLRASNPDNANKLEQLATSLEREYTYAGKYPNSNKVGGVFTDNGSNTFPDTIDDGDGNMIDNPDAGSKYPLTNKLDYAFLRRPVLNSTEVDPANYPNVDWPYLNENGEKVAATEWTTGVVDWDGTQTTEAEDDYLYIHGWAVVEDPSESESVWTTFSSAGELSGVRFPVYDTDGDYQGATAAGNIIRSADDFALAGTVVDGVTVTANGGNAGAAAVNISFATYNASEYFKLADFSDIQQEQDAIFVKACYEPAEEISWVDDYTVASSPYYIRYGTLSSTEVGSVYSISFDYARVNSNGLGVLRAREPYLRAKYTIDESATGGGFVEGSAITMGVASDSGEIIIAEFTPPGSVYSFVYTLVENFESNFVVGANRSRSGDNEAGVLTNFKYWTTASQPAGEEKVTGWQTGFDYDERLGSEGFVYNATLRQMLETGTQAVLTGSAVIKEEFNSYVTNLSLADLNLRLDADGLLPTDDSAEAIIGASNAKQALYEAIEIACKYNEFDETGVASLEWHQLQYHLIEHLAGRTRALDTGTGVRQRDLCGNYRWCRQDGCSEIVNVPVEDLPTALEAVRLTQEADNQATKDAARDALEKNLAEVLKNEWIINTSAKDAGGNFYIDIMNDASSLADSAKYTNNDTSDLIEKLAELLESASTTSLSAGRVQRWLDTYNGTTGDYTEPDDGTSLGADKLKLKYWWMYWDYKPYAIDFTAIDDETDSAAKTTKTIELLIEAVGSSIDREDISRDGNPIAWDGLTKEAIDLMRFRYTARGDFFDSGVYDQRDGSYDTYRSSVSDTRTTLSLRGFEDEASIRTFRERIEAYILPYVEQVLTMDGSDTWYGGKKDALISAAKTAVDGANNNGYTWEQLQYRLLNNSVTDYPDYYSTAGIYWWKEKDARLTYNASNASDGYAYTGATFTDLRNRLTTYKADPTTTGAAKFSAWLTPEVLADLILRDAWQDKSSITGVNDANSVANSLMTLARSLEPSDISDLTWSQVQYYIVEKTVVPTKLAQGTTISDKALWNYKSSDSATAEKNRWREEQQQSITDLKEFLLALDAYAAKAGGGSGYDEGAATLFEQAVVSASDLENLDFRLDSQFANLEDDSLRTALVTMRNAYNTGNNGADRGWATWAYMADTVVDEEVTAGSLTPRDQWYLVQHYLYTGDFTKVSWSATVDVETTITTAKAHYWWEYGWSGISTGTDKFNQLQTAVTSKVPARVYWITNSAEDLGLGVGAPIPGRDLENTVASFLEHTNGARGQNGSELTWTDGVVKTVLLEMQNIPKSNNWWDNFQFLLLHSDQSEAVAKGNTYDRLNVDGVSINLNLYAVESIAFYWWKDWTGAPAAPPYFAATELTDDMTFEEAAAVITKAALLKYAAGNVNDTNGDRVEDIVTAENIQKYLFIRDPKSDTLNPGDSRDLLSPFSMSDDAFLESFERLVATVYEDNASPKGWDYITDTNGVYTYNSAAYDAVLGLSPAAIQHWFATGGESYEPTEEDVKAYWWLTFEEKQADDNAQKEEFAKFFAEVIAYSYEWQGQTATNKKNQVRTKYNSYVKGLFNPDAGINPFGFTEIETTLADIGNYILKYGDQFNTGDPIEFTWLQCQLFIAGRGAHLTADAAIAENAALGNYYPDAPSALSGTITLSQEVLNDALNAHGVTLSLLSEEASASVIDTDADTESDETGDATDAEPGEEPGVYTVEDDVTPDDVTDSTGEETENSGETSLNGAQAADSTEALPTATIPTGGKEDEE